MPEQTDVRLHDIPGFKTLRAAHIGHFWYIVDCTPECGDPWQNAIGGYFDTFGMLCSYAMTQYSGTYQ